MVAVRRFDAAAGNSGIGGIQEFQGWWFSLLSEQSGHVLFRPVTRARRRLTMLLTFPCCDVRHRPRGLHQSSFLPSLCTRPGSRRCWGSKDKRADDALLRRLFRVCQRQWGGHTILVTCA